MSSNTPQLEDGYIRVARELFKAFICYRMSGEERQILDFVILKTYGFQKKEDRISLSQFIEATNIKKQNVHRAIFKLKNKNILVIKKDDHNRNIYCLNKDFNTWKRSSKKMTSKKESSKLITPVIKKDDQKVIKNDEHKRKERNYTKETLLRNGQMPEEFGNPEVNKIKKAFKANIGIIATDAKPGNVAQNIRQMIGAFIRRNNPAYSKETGSSLTFDYVHTKAWEWYMGKGYAHKTERLETFKNKLRAFLDLQEDRIKNFKNKNGTVQTDKERTAKEIRRLSESTRGDEARSAVSTLAGIFSIK